MTTLGIIFASAILGTLVAMVVLILLFFLRLRRLPKQLERKFSMLEEQLEEMRPLLVAKRPPFATLVEGAPERPLDDHPVRKMVQELKKRKGQDGY